MKAYRVVIAGKTGATRDFTVKSIDATNSACLMLTGIYNKAGAWNDDRFLLIPWTELLLVDVNEVEVSD